MRATTAAAQLKGLEQIVGAVRTLPELQDWSWQFVSAHLHQPSSESGWVTDVDFRTPSGVRRFRFAAIVSVKDLIPEFECLRITDRSSSERFWIEDERFLIEVICHDAISASFVADDVMEIPVVDPSQRG